MLLTMVFCVHWAFDSGLTFIGSTINTEQTKGLKGWMDEWLCGMVAWVGAEWVCFDFARNGSRAFNIYISHWKIFCFGKFSVIKCQCLLSKQKINELDSIAVGRLSRHILDVAYHISVDESYPGAMYLMHVSAAPGEVIDRGAAGGGSRGGGVSVVPILSHSRARSYFIH